MLSPAAVRSLGKLINIGHYVFGCHPFYWDGKKKRFCRDPSIKYKFLYGSQVCLQILYQCFMVSRCIQTVQSDAVTEVIKARAVYTTLAFMSQNANHIVAVKSYGTLHSLLNAFNDVSRAFKDDHGFVHNGQESKKAISFIRIICFLWFFMSMTQAVNHVRNPSEPHLLTSLAAEPDMLPLLIRAFLGYVQFRIVAFQTCFLGTYFSVVVCYINSVIPMIRRMRINPTFALEQQNCSRDERRKAPDMELRDLCKYYTQLAVLQKNYNAVLGDFIIIADISCLYICTMNLALAVIYTSIRLRSLIVAMSMLLIAKQSFGTFSQIHEKTLAVLTSWTSVMNPPAWFKKYRRACQPQKITLGSFFYIDSGFILTFFHIVVSKAVDIIVTYKVE